MTMLIAFLALIAMVNGILGLKHGGDAGGAKQRVVIRVRTQARGCGGIGWRVAYGCKILAGGAAGDVGHAFEPGLSHFIEPHRKFKAFQTTESVRELVDGVVLPGEG